MQGFAAGEVEPVGDQRVQGKQGQHGLVVGPGPGQPAVRAGQHGRDPQLRRAVGAECPGRRRCGTLGVRLGHGRQEFGADQRVALDGRPVMEHRRRRAGRGRSRRPHRPGGRLAYGTVLVAHRGQEQRQLLGDGPAAGHLVALLGRAPARVRAALSYPADQQEHIRRTDARPGDPGQEGHRLRRGLVHRALVQDAAVQLALRLLGRRVVVPGQGAQEAGDVLGAAVGVGVGGPGLGVQFGEEQGTVEVHGADHGSRH